MPTRRQFLQSLGLGAAAAMLPYPSAAADERPNILYIMSDDHAAPGISAYGGFLAKAAPTPNLDRIAREGMLFRNCLVTNSICTPSRAAIFTGKYAHKNGVYKFTALDQSQPTLPKLMQAAGYHTGLVGKYHLHSNPVGLDYWSILPGQGRYHDPQFVEMGDEHASGWVKRGRKTTHKGHSSDVIGDKTIHYLKNVRPKDKPFFFCCHFKAPHDTWQYAERYESYLADVEVPEPTTLHDDYATRSDALRTTTQKIGMSHTNYVKPRQEPDERKRKSACYQVYIKKYLRCVKGIDDNVGRILDTLAELGLDKNTIVLYTADQGFFLGEHGLYDKRFFYEEALRMPLLAKWPGRVQPGSTNEDLVLNVDFAPTLLEAVGAKPHPDMQGRSFLSQLGGTTPADWRQAMYYRYYVSHFKTEPHYGVRTKTHKLIYYDRKNQWELFDLTKDPNELKNIVDDPASAATVEKLKAELTRLQKELGDDPKDVGDRPRTGFEKR
jgi:arylsulfatase A-like enzyme